MSVPPGQPAGPEEAAPLPGCARHPDRPTGLRCTRCERPACPDCLREASVGYHCVDCLAQSSRGGREAVTVAGARINAKPVVVPVLIVLNVLAFAAMAFQAGSIQNNAASEVFYQFSLWPVGVAGGQWIRLLSSGFLHIGPIHLLMNMVALWIIGRDLETVLGRLRFTAVYFLSLLGGSALVFLLGAADQPVAGASGAVYGLMGGIAIAALRLKVSLRPVLIVIALNIVLSISIPGISLLGHLGGLALGAAATAALVYAPRERRVPVQAAALGGLLLLLVVVVVTRDLSMGPIHCIADRCFGG
ncbi:MULTISPECIES: rhomboid family intramembrane serine protease [Saccharopolyspora]|uniref:Rhomboid family intramembrane serine protease n=1 Tax=Saccharopolyspora gregorii TaxID=33914 RepID=A0ABP6RZY2_9PSEU|nr:MULTISPECIES: rhomboid family intramembrane serine protease [unclassified Saccharopolyspora]MCA1191805.1 rhomboid family intramembrane serine protease [Saccharopolyspora sp. 6V]MCA1227354.1 rhomboid family intramembrane serine protease [Saccharopolyspora sp. 6M]